LLGELFGVDDGQPRQGRADLVAGREGMELLQARMPTPDEVRLLELDPGVPVVRMLHIDFAPDGRTLALADDLYAADRHEFAFEWTEPDGAPADE
jgi:GntR family transcriptional regulator